MQKKESPSLKFLATIMLLTNSANSIKLNLNQPSMKKIARNQQQNDKLYPYKEDL